MNRKSMAASFRKSVRTRESQVPSGSLPSSARRGFGNRTILDNTRNSLAGGRLSLYNSSQPKDCRTFNDEFILSTFAKLKAFFDSRKANIDFKFNIPKITAKQFETIFTLLFSEIDGTHVPPKATNWMESEVPLIVECLGYTTKVTKSMLQGVSAKPGPIVGIIDYMLDLIGQVCIDSDIQLLCSGENEIEMETDELIRKLFMNGVVDQSGELADSVSELCRKHKGIIDEDQIEAERETVEIRMKNDEDRLQGLQLKLDEIGHTEEAIEALNDYMSAMKVRYSAKIDELEANSKRAVELQSQATSVESLIDDANRVIASQPMSMDEILRVRNNIKDLESSLARCQLQIRDVTVKTNGLRSSLNIMMAERESLSSELISFLENTQVAVSKDMLTDMHRDPAKMQRFFELAQKAYDAVNKQISEQRNEAEQKQFELEHEEGTLKNQVSLAKQDTDTQNKKLEMVRSKLADKQVEYRKKRKAIQDKDTQILLVHGELDDLNTRISSAQDEHTFVSQKHHSVSFECAAARLYIKKFKEKVDACKEIDMTTMGRITEYINAISEGLQLSKVNAAILESLSSSDVEEFAECCEKIRNIQRDGGPSDRS